jgi:beta-lactam-binding protein with PASTA domain
LKLLFVAAAFSGALALAFAVGMALRPTLFPTASSSATGVVPSVVGLHGRAALRTLAVDGFGVLPVPVVPRDRQQFDSAVVYRQFPAAGTRVSDRLMTIYVRTR